MAVNGWDVLKAKEIWLPDGSDPYEGPTPVPLRSALYVTHVPQLTSNSEKVCELFGSEKNKGIFEGHLTTTAERMRSGLEAASAQLPGREDAYLIGMLIPVPTDGLNRTLNFTTFGISGTMPTLQVNQWNRETVPFITTTSRQPGTFQFQGNTHARAKTISRITLERKLLLLNSFETEGQGLTITSANMNELILNGTTYIIAGVGIPNIDHGLVSDNPAAAVIDIRLNVQLREQVSTDIYSPGT